MTKKYLSYFSLLVFIFGFACSRGIKVNEVYTTDELNFEYFKSKAKVSLMSESDDASVTMILRMQDAKVIWASLSKFGKEAVRVKLTKDSAYYINKYPSDEQFYSIISTKEYLEKSGMALSFDDFQDLLFGNHPLKIEKKDSVVIKDSTINISQSRNGVLILSSINKNTSKLNQTKVISPSRLDTVKINFKSYQQIGTHYIPTVYEFDISKKNDSTTIKTISIVELLTPEFTSEELGFSFNIPDTYEKR